jgi:hypothetical protein
VIDGNSLTVRTAPCPTAPAVKRNGTDLVLDYSSGSFEFPDYNSKQVSACELYGYGPKDNSTCWIQINYQGISGWLPRTRFAGGYPTAKCLDVIDQKATKLVESPGVDSLFTQCGVAPPTCFPADATARLHTGEVQPMSELQIGQKVRHVLSRQPANTQLPCTSLSLPGTAGSEWLQTAANGLPTAMALVDILASDVHLHRCTYLPAQVLALLCEHRPAPIPTSRSALLRACFYCW